MADLAARQHGVVARRQLLGLGLGAAAMDYRIALGRLHVVRRGVYALGHRRLTKQGRYMAAVLACGPGAVASHRTAADLWQLKSGGTRIEVSVVAAGRRSVDGVLLHQPRAIDRADRGFIDNIPVTSLARTLVDLAAVVDERRLARAFEEAERIGELDLRAVEEVLARSHGRRGVRAVKVFIAERRPATNTREGLERDFADLIREAGLPMPAFNVLIEGFLVDAVWTPQRLIVEVDSYAFHDRTRRTFEQERARHNALTLRGWTVVRLTDAQMPEAAEIVRQMLSAARAA